MEEKTHCCPSCGNYFALHTTTYKVSSLAFNHRSIGYLTNPPEYLLPMIYEKFFQCPSCEYISIRIELIEKDQTRTEFPILPLSDAKIFPSYVPEQLRSDYEEAYSIASLSPKASATLSRRCLQGMIQDFWKVRKGSLYEQINAIQGKVSASQWKAIDGLRKIGNIGAHMEKDVDVIIDVEADEAVLLLKLIELLIEKWYIARYDEQKLYNTISEISDNKKDL